MTSVDILCVGNLKESYFREAAAEYLKRLSAYFKVGVTEFAESPAASGRLLSALRPRAYKIALCVEGVQMSSEELAALFERLAVNGTPAVDFVIGGPDGLSEQVKSACDMRLSFSRMTFPHRLMRVILLEQLYRAGTIINGEKYHK